MTLCIFNPEHDLCLANGDRNFVPPASALDFASGNASLMGILYPDARCASVADDLQPLVAEGSVDRIVAWGWDARLKQALLKQGVPQSLLPPDEQLERIRELQHRSTILPLQPHAWRAYSVDEVQRLLTEEHRVVLKAPWSGSGRGLRWVDDELSDHDTAWIAKTVASQRCVIVERRLDVVENFALEFYTVGGNVTLIGLSLFETQSGVYRCNILLDDDEIRQRLQLPGSVENAIRQWLRLYVAPRYEGPVGVDLLKDKNSEFFVSEMNLRYTMGLVAHAFLEAHPDRKGSRWSPTVNTL